LGLDSEHPVNIAVNSTAVINMIDFIRQNLLIISQIYNLSLSAFLKTL